MKVVEFDYGAQAFVEDVGVEIVINDPHKKRYIRDTIRRGWKPEYPVVKIARVVVRELATQKATRGSGQGEINVRSRQLPEGVIATTAQLRAHSQGSGTVDLDFSMDPRGVVEIVANKAEHQATIGVGVGVSLAGGVVGILRSLAGRSDGDTVAITGNPRGILTIKERSSLANAKTLDRKRARMAKAAVNGTLLDLSRSRKKHDRVLVPEIEEVLLSSRDILLSRGREQNDHFITFPFVAPQVLGRGKHKHWGFAWGKRGRITIFGGTGSSPEEVLEAEMSNKTVAELQYKEDKWQRKYGQE